MLIDTRVVGWKVLYCNQAWKEWTGGAMVIGCTALRRLWDKMRKVSELKIQGRAR
jgi:hypothetical protein